MQVVDVNATHQTVGSIICISQGGQKYSICVDFLFDVACEKLLKSAIVSRSYSKNKSGIFLWTTVYFILFLLKWFKFEFLSIKLY